MDRKGGNVFAEAAVYLFCDQLCPLSNVEASFIRFFSSKHTPTNNISPDDLFLWFHLLIQYTVSIAGRGSKFRLIL